MYLSIVIIIVVVLGLVYLFFRALNLTRTPKESKLAVSTPPVGPIQMAELWAPTCFAQGIVKSLVEERDMWKEQEFDDCGMGVEKIRMRHSGTGVFLVVGISSYMCTGQRSLAGGFDYVHVKPHPLNSMNRVDENHIAEAIVANPIGQYKKQLEIYRKDEEKKTKATKYFEQLGCPSNTVTTNTTTTT